ncbi:prepilin-type N-terminal cleavage/methylation domain-containing protein [Sodalis praecaptivus]|nr:prepilin-type N-terminal cleavage/methylation domain-containing protein [Sodalis praecaptivus]
MRDRQRRRRPDPQRGAGLAEALLATALLALTALGLLDYRQRLAVFQRRLQDVSLALSLCHQRLELLRQPTAPGALSQPLGWRISVIEISCDAACRRVTAMVTLPTGERVSLNEWVCQNPADITGT